MKPISYRSPLREVDICFAVLLILSLFQYVRVANDCSSKHKLACGVKQGSVLGPIRYSMYTAPIADVIKRHGMGFHFYADDTQIYMSFNPSDALQP